MRHRHRAKKTTWLPGEKPEPQSIVLNDGETLEKNKKKKVTWTTPQPSKREKRAARKKITKWNDGEKEKHDNAVFQEDTLPWYVYAPDSCSKEVEDALRNGPGASFRVLKDCFTLFEEEKRIAPLLMPARSPTNSTTVKKGSIAVYLGSVQCNERRNVMLDEPYLHNGNPIIIVTVNRHLFLVGNARWMITELQTLKPL